MEEENVMRDGTAFPGRERAAPVGQKIADDDDQTSAADAFPTAEESFPGRSFRGAADVIDFVMASICVVWLRPGRYCAPRSQT